MAIITENIIINNKNFIKTYSNSNRYVVRDGISYSEAIDPSEFNRIYTEGDEIPEDGINSSNADEILNIILGGDDV